MKTINGNLFNSNEINYIFHQCNCFKAMKSGFAKSLVELYPEAKIADDNSSNIPKNKLGSFSFAPINSISKPNLKGVYNIYGQFNFGTDKIQTDYNALNSGLLASVKSIKQNSIIGIPYLIGCGLAGGNCQTVLNILQNIENNNPHISFTLFKI